MQIKEYADRDALALSLAATIAGALKRALLARGTVSLAVPGGTTPGPIFDLLSATPLAWGRVTVFLTDERWVSDNHERSNAGLIRSRLLQNAANAATFIPYFKPDQTAHDACPALSDAMAPHLPLSVLLLGMGADMHTASLFPGARGLDAALAADAPAICAIDTDSQPEPRITISAPVLDRAEEKHLVIFGDEKRRALEAAMTASPQDAPIKAVINGGGVHWAA